MMATKACWRCKGDGYHPNLANVRGGDGPSEKYLVCGYCKGKGIAIEKDNLEKIKALVAKIQHDG